MSGYTSFDSSTTRVGFIPHRMSIAEKEAEKKFIYFIGVALIFAGGVIAITGIADHFVGLTHKSIGLIIAGSVLVGVGGLVMYIAKRHLNH